jgi:hypothetical protein
MMKPKKKQWMIPDKKILKMMREMKSSKDIPSYMSANDIRLPATRFCRDFYPRMGIIHGTTA